MVKVATGVRGLSQSGTLNVKRLHTCITVWHVAAKSWNLMMALALLAVLIA